MPTDLLVKECEDGRMSVDIDITELMLDLADIGSNSMVDLVIGMVNLLITKLSGLLS
jgi:hypothetical protein